MRKRKKLPRSTITDSLIGELREEIRSGKIAPGSRLRQLEVAENFGVSSTPVREAFSALEREGLLVSSPHRGVVVFHPTVDDLHETYDIRIPLEALATEKAVENMTDGDLEDLDALLGNMAASVDKPSDYTKLNRVFHQRIYSVGHRPKLERLIEDLRDSSAAYLRLYSALELTAEQTQQEHEEIVAGCRARDPKAAADAVERHLRHTVRRVSEGLPDTEPSENGER